MDVLRIEPSPLLHGVAELPAPGAGTPPSALLDSLRVHAGEEVVRWVVKLAQWGNQPHHRLRQLAEALHAWSADLQALGGKLVLLFPAEHWHITTSFQGLPIFSDEPAAIRALAVSDGGSAHPAPSGGRASSGQMPAARTAAPSSRRQSSSTRQTGQHPRLSIHRKEVPGGTSILRLLGPFDTNTVASFQHTVEQCRLAGNQKLILDLYGVSHVNSTGLGALVRVTEELNAEGGALALINVPPRVANVFDMLGLRSFFLFFDDEASACEHFAGLVGPKLDLQVTIAGLSLAFVPFSPFEATALGRVVGVLSAQAAAGLGKKLEELCAKGWKKLVLDISQVPDAPGAEMLAEWAEYLRDQGAMLVLVQARPAVRDAFDTAGLPDIAWFFRDLDDARAYLRKGAEGDEPSNVGSSNRIGGFMPPRPGSARRPPHTSSAGSGSLPAQSHPTAAAGGRAAQGADHPPASPANGEATPQVRASSSGRLAKAPAVPDGPATSPARQRGSIRRVTEQADELSNAAAGEEVEIRDAQEASSSQTQTGRSPALGPSTPPAPHQGGEHASSSRRQAIVDEALAKESKAGTSASEARGTEATEQAQSSPPKPVPPGGFPLVAPVSSVEASPPSGTTRTPADEAALRLALFAPRTWHRLAAHSLSFTVTADDLSDTSSAPPLRVTLVPQLPGCLVTPSHTTVALTAEQPRGEATFHVMPVLTGVLPPAHLEVVLEGDGHESTRGHFPLTSAEGASWRVRAGGLLRTLPWMALLVVLGAALLEALGPTAQTLLGQMALALLQLTGSLLLPAVLFAAGLLLLGHYLRRRAARPPKTQHVIHELQRGDLTTFRKS